MEIHELIKKIEALIFAADRPLPFIEIWEIINQQQKSNAEQNIQFSEEISTDEVKAAVEAAMEKYQQEFYPFEIKLTGGGYCFLTKKEYYDTVAPVCQDKKIKRLSTAAMETLAIIAYKQPVTKSEIEFLRGVSSEYSVQKLLEKELIVIAGRKEDSVGKPLIYKTSPHFIDYLGIQSFDDLPKISELFDMNIVLPTEPIRDENGNEILVEANFDEEILDTELNSNS